MFSFHTLVLYLKGEFTLWAYGIKLQRYKVTNQVIFVFKRCKPMEICNSVFDSVVLVCTLWLLILWPVVSKFKVCVCVYKSTMENMCILENSL